MPSQPPLTAETLAQFVADQQEIEQGIAEDCAALEDMLVRLAGPTLQGIEDDTAAIQEIVDKLAEPIVTGTRKDTQQLLRMGRKLVAPIDQGISEDTTILTGIAARAYGAKFPVDTRMRLDGGKHPHPGKVVPGRAHPAARHTGPSHGPARVGLSSPPSRPAPGRVPGSAPGGATHGPTFPPGIASPGAEPSLSPAPYFPQFAHEAGGAIGSDSVAMRGPDQSGYGESFPPLPEVEVEGSAPPTPGANGYGRMPSLPPFQPPTPFAPSREPLTPAGAGSPFALPSAAAALPPPPPPLPEPPLDTTDLCACIMYAAQAVGGQLAAIAQALYAQRPDVRAAHVEGPSPLGVADVLEWVDPDQWEQTVAQSVPWDERQGA